jgi:hypothetical protein
MTTQPETKSDRDLSILEWCVKRNYSRSTFFKLQRAGHAPKVRHIPGSNCPRITPAADAQWEKDMEKLATEQAGKLEASRRVELASAAGKKAAASELHVSKRYRPKS